MGYQHKVYEFAIPLRELGVSVGSKTALELAFAAYGTAAPPTYYVYVCLYKDFYPWFDDVPEVRIGYDYASSQPNESYFVDGTYNIYVNGIDIGVDVTVPGEFASDVHFNTLTLIAGTGIESVSATLIYGICIDSYSGGGLYLLDAEVELNAVVSPGYVFDRWSDGTDALSCFICMSRPQTLTAYAVPAPTPEPTAMPTSTPTKTPKPKPKPKPAATPTPTPTATAEPTATPTPTPTPTASTAPTGTPSAAPSTAPPQSPAPDYTGVSGPAAGAPNAGGGSGWVWWLLGGIAAAGVALVLAFLLVRRLRKK